MASSYLNELNEKQRKAVEHTGSPLLILAGAGSGKTKTLTYKAAHTVKQGVGPEKLLLVTFTNKAADEMKERVREIVGKDLPHVGTFHWAGARILREDGRHVGVTRDFVIYDQKDQKALVKEIVDEFGIDKKRFKPRSLLHTISEAKQEMVEPEEYFEIASGPFQETAARVYGEYQKRLRKYGALDFDDLLGKAVKLLKENEGVLDKYRERFAYVYVDEYQDTNAAQYEFTKILARGHKRLCVVGDASQSIYRWRGADYRNILKLKKDFPEIEEVRLERNYRSTEKILKTAEQIISNNTTHPVLSLWTEENGGEKIGLIETRTGKREASEVLRRIDEWRVKKRMDWSDFAILYRTNAQSRVFEEAMVRKGVPYTLVGGIKFYERTEIKDVLAYLRLMHNPEDGVARTRAKKRGKRRLGRLMAKREEIEVENYTVSELLSLIYEVTNYLDRYDEEKEDEAAKLENVAELDSLAEEFSELGEFLENVALVQAEYYSDELKQEKDGVTLMTLHAAKGLEFEVVFMVGMEEGLFPHSRSMMDKEELEEERRLCYVGITRAKKKLYMSHARGRLLYGSWINNERSRFIDEVKDGLFEQITRVGERQEKGRRKKGVKIDSLSDETLEGFLDGEISVEELLK